MAQLSNFPWKFFVVILATQFNELVKNSSNSTRSDVLSNEKGASQLASRSKTRDFGIGM